MTVHDTQNPETREDALAAAVDAVRGGRLIVLPTDTVYGIGADAFTPDAVQALLEAKGRGRDTPPPVLIGDHAVLLALATDVPDYVEDLTDALWPGALTLILTAQPSLTWDLGETRGTVALRMPEDETALELLRSTGPLAVSSANRTGKPAATSILDAATQLGDSVEVYLDGGPARIGESSTILDTTVTPAEIVRQGAVTKEQIIEVVGDIFTAPEPAPEDVPEDSDGDASENSEVSAGSVDTSDEADATAAGADGDAEVGADGAESSAETPAAAAATGAAGTEATADDAAGAAAVPAEPATTIATEDPATDGPGATSVLDLPSEPDPGPEPTEPVASLTEVSRTETPLAVPPLEGADAGDGLDTVNPSDASDGSDASATTDVGADAGSDVPADEDRGEDSDRSESTPG